MNSANWLNFPEKKKISNYIFFRRASSYALKFGFKYKLNIFFPFWHLSFWFFYFFFSLSVFISLLQVFEQSLFLFYMGNDVVVPLFQNLMMIFSKGPLGEQGQHHRHPRRTVSTGASGFENGHFSKTIWRTPYFFLYVEGDRGSLRPLGKGGRAHTVGHGGGGRNRTSIKFTNALQVNSSFLLNIIWKKGGLEKMKRLLPGQTEFRFAEMEK